METSMRNSRLKLKPERGIASRFRPAIDRGRGCDLGRELAWFEWTLKGFLAAFAAAFFATLCGCHVHLHVGEKHLYEAARQEGKAENRKQKATEEYEPGIVINIPDETPKR